MPGVMPPMPGIMGAPMGAPPGMVGMPSMPGIPPMQQPMPMPMPMGGPMGGGAPQVQGGGRPASLGTLPAPSTAEQRAGFGAAVGSVVGGPVMGALPSDVFAGGIPGGMMDGSIPRPVARMREGGSVQYMQAGGPAGMQMLRDSSGDIVPGMFVMRYSDGTYSKPGTVLEVEGLRQRLQSGEKASGSLSLGDISSIGDRNQYLKTDGVTVSDVAYAGAGQPFSNEQLGSDMVTVRFADGTMLKTQKGLVDVMQASGALGGMRTAGDFTRAQVDMSAGSSDPESDAARYMNMFNERQVAYDDALRASDPSIARNVEAFRGYADALSGRPVGAGAGMGAGAGADAGMTGGAGVSGAVGSVVGGDVLGQQRGFYENELDVLRRQLSDLQAAYAGPRYTGVLDPASYGMPEGASYQPTLGSIPTFTRGVSDVFGTRPVTYYGSPQATITSGIGSIDLPARPESVNVFDWLANPVSGVGLYRPGGAS